jgi:formylglycine-generating enzyme required for sulfatase activity
MIETPPMIEIIPPGETRALEGGEDEGVFVRGRRLRMGSYSLGKFTLSGEQWEAVMGGRGEAGKGEFPASGLSWREAAVFCNRYSEMEGLDPVYYLEGEEEPLGEASTVMAADTGADRVLMKEGAGGFRLPTEAEWEFAARGGDPQSLRWHFSYAGSEDIDEAAWYAGNAFFPGPESPAYGPHRGGEKKANALGLADMSGNLYEYCWDWYGEISPGLSPLGPGPGDFAHRVIRGGSWRTWERQCRVTARNYFRPFIGSPMIGFRLARSLSPKGTRPREEYL